MHFENYSQSRRRCDNALGQKPPINALLGSAAN